MMYLGVLTAVTDPIMSLDPQASWLLDFVKHSCIDSQERLIILHNWTVCQWIVQTFIETLKLTVVCIDTSYEESQQEIVRRFNDDMSGVDVLLTTYADVEAWMRFDHPRRFLHLDIPGSLLEYVHAENRLAEAAEASLALANGRILRLTDGTG